MSKRKSFCAPIISSCQFDGDSSPALSEISERDKPWDKHRGNADIVSGHYQKAGMSKHSERVTLCSLLLDFKLVPKPEIGELKLKLSSAFFCRVRHCPVCQWRRSLRWKARSFEVLPRVEKDHPKMRWLFLTLTLKNCQLTELRETLEHVNYSFRKLSRRKIFPGVGWIKSVEVTRGKDGKTAHPHLHILMMVKPSYFSCGYISQENWCKLWQSCLKVDYQPILDVQAVKPNKSPTVLISEVIKYQTKESDLIRDPKWFAEYVEQMHKTRAISVGGILQDYFKYLEEEPDDLIGESDEDEVDEGHLRFCWKRKEKKYRMVDQK